jgi:hypothetical protein
VPPAFETISLDNPKLRVKDSQFAMPRLLTLAGVHEPTLRAVTGAVKR